MFDNLSDKLQRVFKNLRGEGKLSAENMEAALREIRVALLEADVHFRVVKQFIEAVKEQAMGQEVLTALSPAQQVVKIVRDEMVKMLGTHQAKLRMANEPPSVIHDRRPAGLRQNHFHGQARALAIEERQLADDGFGRRLPSCGAQAAERAGARSQAADLRRHAGRNASPLELARSARKEAMQTGRDVVLVDTAGRLHIDEDLMTELSELKEPLNPIEILFVADAMTGQDAVKSADEFHKRLGITGVILTKMDGDARGGAALVDPLGYRAAVEVCRRRRKAGRARTVSSRPRRPAHSRHGRCPQPDRERGRNHRPEASRGNAAQADRRRLHARRFPRSDEADSQAGSARIDPGHDAAGRHDEGPEECQGRRERDQPRWWRSSIR